MSKRWFKRKLYGWGWYPCSIEGWVITIVFGFLIGFSIANGQNIFFIILLIIGLFGVCYSKGESPRWSWGKR